MDPNEKDRRAQFYYNNNSSFNNYQKAFNSPVNHHDSPEYLSKIAKSDKAHRFSPKLYSTQSTHHQGDPFFSPSGSQISSQSKNAQNSRIYDNQLRFSQNVSQVLSSKPTSPLQRLESQSYSSKFGLRNSSFEPQKRGPFIDISPRDRSRYQSYHNSGNYERSFETKNYKQRVYNESSYDPSPQNFVDRTKYSFDREPKRREFSGHHIRTGSVDNNYTNIQSSYSTNSDILTRSRKQVFDPSAANIQFNRSLFNANSETSYSNDVRSSKDYSKHNKSKYPKGLNRISLGIKPRTNSLTLKETNSVKSDKISRKIKRYTSQSSILASPIDFDQFSNHSLYDLTTYKHDLDSSFYSEKPPNKTGVYQTRSINDQLNLNYYNYNPSTAETPKFQPSNINKDNYTLPQNLSSLNSTDQKNNIETHSDSSENEKTNDNDNVDIKTLNSKIQTLIKDNFDLKIRNQTLYDSLNSVQINDIQGLVSDFSRARSSNIRATEKINKLKAQISKLKSALKQCSYPNQMSETASVNSFATSSPVTSFSQHQLNNNYDPRDVFEVMQGKISCLEKDLAATQNELQNAIEHASVIQCRYEDSLKQCKQLQISHEKLNSQQSNNLEYAKNLESFSGTNQFELNSFYSNSTGEENVSNRLRAGTVDTSETLNINDIADLVNAGLHNPNKSPTLKKNLLQKLTQEPSENNPNVSDLLETISILNKSRDEYKNSYDLLSKRYETELSRYDKQLFDYQTKNEKLETEVESYKQIISEFQAKNEQLENMISAFTDAVPVIENRNFNEPENTNSVEEQIQSLAEDISNLEIEIKSNEESKVNKPLENYQPINQSNSSAHVESDADDQIISEKELLGDSVMGKDYNQNQSLINRIFNKVIRKSYTMPQEPEIHSKSSSAELTSSKYKDTKGSYLANQPEWSTVYNFENSRPILDFLLGTPDSKGKSSEKSTPNEKLTPLNISNNSVALRSMLDVNSSTSSIFKSNIDFEADLVDTPSSANFKNGVSKDIESYPFGITDSRSSKNRELIDNSNSNKKNKETKSSMYDDFRGLTYI
ncbi:hypothetical protein AYI69_g1970 [Smittium culicis]|uniref:Centrosomin N-terminal motif 1 domain-containing protein n=1 Tax=Smittium culicis TaxID=133412 RepID=A0A1R1YNX9_9FUNG|nr:hypothetical protein AYI69_g1970 [Smittium culicis]